MVEALRHGVVLITSLDERISRFGTGFVIGHVDGKTLVVTCAHVVRDVGGVDQVRIAGKPATQVAAAAGGWPDLAVLSTSAAADAPALELRPGAARDQSFSSEGFRRYGDEYLIRAVGGRLGEPVDLESASEGLRIRAFDLAIDSDAALQPGYSGSPVADNRGRVVAVVSHREGDGQKGLAIAIEGLRAIWPDADRFLVPARPEPGRRRSAIPLAVVAERTNLFVGRAEEWRVLEDHLDAALDGQGGYGFIVGEPGSGKSTLAFKALRKVMEERPDCVTAVARVDVVSGAHTSYGPFKTILEQCLLAGGSDDQRPIDIAAETLRGWGIRRLGFLSSFTGMATAELQALLASPAPGEPIDETGPTVDQGSLFDLYVKILCNIADRTPLVIVLDDLHWADDSSLLLLEWLMRAVEYHPILLLGTWRSDEIAGKPLLRQIQQRATDGYAFHIDLKKSDQRDPEGRQFCRDYLMARYGTVFSEDFLGFLCSITGGSPLFVAETLTNLEEQDILQQVEGSWRMDPPVTSLDELPTRIERVISQRVERLEQALIEILKAASIEGEVFTAEVVARLRGSSDQELLMMVAEKLMRVHQLVVAGATRRSLSGRSLHTFGFRHVLTRRYIYDYVLTEPERVELHRQYAGALEALWGEESGEIAPQLATHYSLANEEGKAVEFALIAGERYLDEYGWSEATKFGRLALRILTGNPAMAGKLPPETVARVRLLYARGELEGGVPGEAIDHAGQGFEALAPALADVDVLDRRLAVDIYLTLGRLEAIRSVITDFHALRYTRKAIEIAEEIGDIRTLLAALPIYHVSTNVADQSMAAEQLATRKRCVELAEQLGDPIELAKALCRLAEHYVVFDTGEPDPLGVGEAHAQRALEIVEHRNIVVELQARTALSWIYHSKGQYGPKLETHRKDLLETARQHGQTTYEVDSLLDVAHYYTYFLDTAERALTLNQQAFDFRVRLGRHPVIETEHRAFLLFRLARFEESNELLRQFLDRQDAPRAARARAHIAWALALTGEDVAAREILGELAADPALDGAANPPAVMAHAALGDHAGALELARPIEEMVPAAGRRGQFWTYWDFPTALAEVRRLAGDLESASEWIERAAGYWRAIDTTPRVRDTMVMFWEHEFVRAKVLFDRGDPLARALLTEVCEMFERSAHRLLPEALLALALAEGDDGEWREHARRAAVKAEALNLTPVLRQANALLSEPS
ncbi:MAG TPA: AAA family ATPase [Amycolatopsis sp.]|nr:AAA family ATPase [Amycolatopsis sp.]